VLAVTTRPGRSRGLRARPGDAAERPGEEIEEAFFAQPFREIHGSLPGIGPRTGARILAEIADGCDFGSGTELAA
jgi:hypothetical protein